MKRRLEVLVFARRGYDDSTLAYHPARGATTPDRKAASIGLLVLGILILCASSCLVGDMATLFVPPKVRPGAPPPTADIREVAVSVIIAFLLLVAGVTKIVCDVKFGHGSQMAGVVAGALLALELMGLLFVLGVGVWSTTHSGRMELASFLFIFIPALGCATVECLLLCALYEVPSVAPTLPPHGHL